MISLIIPTYRNPKYLELCLRSAIEFKTQKDTEIIVIVDGYFKESEEILKSFPEVKFLDLVENRGMQYAINAGVMQASNKYVFVINDDNVLPVMWDKRLEREIELRYKKDNDKFVMTVNQIEPTGPGMFDFVVQDLGKTPEGFDYAAWRTWEPSIQHQDPITANGRIFPFLMEKKYFLACGGLDTFYDSPNVCDWDFFLKLELLGFHFFRTNRLHLYHFGSVATKKNKESQKFLDKEARAFETYEWKWGVAPYNGKNNTKIPPNKQFRGFTLES